MTESFNKKKPRTYLTIPPTLLVMVFFYWNAEAVAPTLTRNDVVHLFSWTRMKEDALNKGTYSSVTIGEKTETNDITTINGHLNIAALDWLIDPRIRIVINNRKPDYITNYSRVYESCEWLDSIILETNTETRKVYFPFPQLTPSAHYSKYSKFVVPFADSMEAHFFAIEDGLFSCTFKNKNDENQNAWAAPPALHVLTTASHTLRINSIECNGLYRKSISDYLGTDLTELSSDADYYGIDILDSTDMAPPIEILSVTVNTDSTLFTNSTYTVSWELGANADQVSACSLSVSVDGGTSWYSTGGTGPGTFSLPVPIPSSFENKTCRFKVRAFGTKNQSEEAFSRDYRIVAQPTFAFDAVAVNDSSVALTWNASALPAGKFSRMRLVYATTKTATAFPEQSADTIGYSLEDIGDTLTGLTPGITYYFSLFGLTNDGLFELVEPNAVDSVTSTDRNPPLNDYVLSATADSHTVRLSWTRTSENESDAAQIRILRNDYRFPRGVDDQESSTLGTFAPSDTSFVVDNLKSSMTYYFALIPGDEAGNWAEPTMQSRVPARLKSDVIDTTTSAVIDIEPTDTQKLFRSTLSLWTTTGLHFHDTLDSWIGPHEGFVAASPAYVFRNGSNIINPLGAKSEYDAKISGTQAAQLRLYQFDRITGRWYLQGPSILIDTVTNTATFEVGRLDRPFALMIDTTAPTLSLHSSPSAISTVDQWIIDTFSVRENIANFTVTLLAGAGDIKPLDITLYADTAGDYNGLPRIITRIPPGIASQCSGLRAYIIIGDGIVADTTRLNKPIKRLESGCNNINTIPMKWTPVMVTAIPDEPSLKSVMSNALGSAWHYDTEEARIIKWLPESKNTFGGGWVEYGKTADSLFECRPGGLLWIKAHDGVGLHYSSGVVPGLIDTSTIKLRAQNWTDFSIPYDFDIYVGDVLDATVAGDKNAPVDELEIYSWNKSQGNYSTQPEYLAAMPDLNNKLDTLRGAQPYTIYNPAPHPVTLRIPPISTTVSQQQVKSGLAKKTSSSQAWSIRVGAITDETVSLSPVFCGYAPGNDVNIGYPRSPSFAPVAIAVRDNETQQVRGHIVSKQTDGDGASFEILFENNEQEKRTIYAFTNPGTSFPENYSVEWINPNDEIHHNGIDSLGVTLDAGKKEYRILAAGNEDYLQGVRNLVLGTRLKLLAPYPNPFAKRVIIRYTLPYLNLETLYFALYNLQGKRIWQRKITHGLRPGSNSLLINEEFAAGAYILRMEVRFAEGGKKRVLSRKLMCLR